MGKILDLAQFVQDPLAVKLLDGRVLNLNKATQKMAIKIMAFKSIDDKTSPEQILAALNDIIFLILNNNVEGEKIVRNEVQNMPDEAKVALLSEYAKYTQGVQSDPN